MSTAKAKDITTTTYRRLVDSVRQQIARSRNVIEHQTVLTYWSVGRSMQDFLKKDPKWGADIALARRLSKDIDIDVRTLQQALQFYRAYPKLDNKLSLTWSHYRVLMTVEDPSRRARWEKRAARENLGIDRLRELIREAAAPKADGAGAKLPQPVRGPLYHYRLIKVGYVNDAPGGIMLDCGFASRIVPPPYQGELVNKRIMRADKTEGLYTLAVSKVTAEQIFTYKAVIERVVDGDTVLANIDCGFGLWTRQYLRLKGIDAPELRAAGGIKARDWLAGALSSCPFVIAKTHKSDKFDRYLADIFYLPRETDPAKAAAEGRYINQELLDKGLVWVWEER
jgi:endonuclease YncB( thermonuclease family)